MTFYTLINYFRKLLDFFGCNIQTCMGWNSHTEVFLRIFVSKIWKHKKGDKWNIDNDKNIQKLLRIRLLGFLLFRIPGRCFCWRVVFGKMSGLQPANVIKTKFLRSSFQRFCLFLGTAKLRNNSFLLIG